MVKKYLILAALCAVASPALSQERQPIAPKAGPESRGFVPSINQFGPNLGFQSDQQPQQTEPELASPRTNKTFAIARKLSADRSIQCYLSAPPDHEFNHTYGFTATRGVIRETFMMRQKLNTKTFNRQYTKNPVWTAGVFGANFVLTSTENPDYQLVMDARFVDDVDEGDGSEGYANAKMLKGGNVVVRGRCTLLPKGRATGMDDNY